MRTTIDLPDLLFRQVKSEAAQRGLKLKELVVEALEKEIAAKTSRPRTLRFPLIKGTGKRKIHPTRKELDESLWD